jgi:hypothetical protein
MNGNEMLIEDANGSGQMIDERQRWINADLPYYTQLPEEQPRSGAKKCDYLFRIIFPLIALILATFYFYVFLTPYLVPS